MMSQGTSARRASTTAVGLGRPTLLDSLLSGLFGRSFASVLEFESQSAFGVDLERAMMTNPVQAYSLLKKVFVVEEAVDVILNGICTKAKQLDATPEHVEFRQALSRVKSNGGTGNAPC